MLEKILSLKFPLYRLVVAQASGIEDIPHNYLDKLNLR